MTTFNPYPVSNSRLSAFKKSPSHLIQYLTSDKLQTPAMAFGSAFHMALLQPDMFTESYAVAPDVDRRSKDGKLAYDKFVYEADGKTVISAADHAKIDDMINRIRINSVANELLTGCTGYETELNWNNIDTGIAMRGFIDAVGPAFIIDIKTTTNADPYTFHKDIFRNYYHRQAAIYLDALDMDIYSDYYIIAVEKEAPYGVSVHQLQPDVIEAGRKIMIDQLYEYRHWVDASCPDSSYDYWTAPGIYNVELPKYLTA